MQSPAIKGPPELKRKMQFFTTEQKTLNKKRLDLLESLRFVTMTEGHSGIIDLLFLLTRSSILCFEIYFYDLYGNWLLLDCSLESLLRVLSRMILILCRAALSCKTGSLNEQPCHLKCTPAFSALCFVCCTCLIADSELATIVQRNMRPPNSTKSAVYQWNTGLTDICRQLGMFILESFDWMGSIKPKWKQFTATNQLKERFNREPMRSHSEDMQNCLMHGRAW